MRDDILKVEHLSVGFRSLGGQVEAVRDVSFQIPRNRVTAIVGESGCGKSVTAKAVMGLIHKPGKLSDESKIFFNEDNILEYSKKEWEAFRGQKCSIVFQDALASLNPTMTIGNQIMEKIRQHRKVSKKEAREEAIRMLEMVGIPNAAMRMNQYPHEFSGGMRQRVMIAIALTLHPELVIADEPTTALDVTVQADIIDLLKQLKEENGMTVVIITHDLGIVANFANYIIVMYAGKILEEGTAEEIFYDAGHPYTQALLRAVPRLDIKDAVLESIEGVPPSMIHPPQGCPFAERCKHAKNQCWNAYPEEVILSESHRVWCFPKEED